MAKNDDFELRALELMADALDVNSDARADWVRMKAGGDKALATRVLTLLDVDTESSVQLKTGGAREAVEEAPPPERVGAYKIVDLIGRGGMGAVYLGEREAGDFEHQVAIKLIKPGLLTEPLVERFTRERQILAKLNHPNIARLFDGGALTDGTPYIVMEFIEGKGIVDHAKSAGTTLKERLALFRAACTAVRHAHQNLVIHRDITPTNVLVTKTGDVKLIDFGIAKPHEIGADVDAGPGSLQSLTFTPGFAAPERSKGAGANTLSDIYSLGKLLEALLDPFMVDDDLEAIIDRSTQTEPSDRYASVDALIDDLDAYAENRPVEARGAGAGYMFGKFLKRRKFVVAGLAAAFAAITVAFINAQTQYNRAEARFEQARNLAQDLLADVYYEFTKVPGTLAPRERFAEILTEYTDGLAADPYAPDDVLFDVGRMYGQLTEVYGGIGVASLEDYDRAYELLAKAEEALDELLRRDPDNLIALAERSRIHRIRSGFDVYAEGNTASGIANLESAIAMAERVMDSGSEDIDVRESLWNARLDRLNFLGWAGRQQDVIDEVPALLDQLDIEEELLPQKSTMRSDILRRYGEALIDLERDEEGVPFMRQAISLLDRAAEESGETESYNVMVKRLSALNMLAQAERRLNDPTSLETARKTLEIAELIRDADPDDVNGRVYVVTASEALAKALASFGDGQEAVAVAKEAVAERRRLIEDFPDARSHVSFLAFTLSSLGTTAETVGDVPAACEAFSESLEVFQELGETWQLTEYERDFAVPTVQSRFDYLGCES